MSERGRLLKTDFTEVDSRLAESIKQRKYRKVSAEVYDAPPEGLPREAVLNELQARGIKPAVALAEATKHAEARKAEIEAQGETVTPAKFNDLVDDGLRAPLGKMLRRVAVLGGEIPQLKTLADIPDPKPGQAGAIPGVETFAPGVHRDKEYTPADMDAMARNFKAFSSGPKPLVRVPVVLGHEEDQAFWDRTDLPAFGWVGNAYSEQFASGVPVLLKFSEVRRGAKPGVFHVFSEVGKFYGGYTGDTITAGAGHDILFEGQAMTPEQAKLIAWGFDQKVVESMSPEQVAETIKVLGPKLEGQPPAEGGAPTEPVAPMADAPAAPAVTQPAAPAAPAAPAVPGISGQPSSITMKFSELKPHERKAFAADVAAALKADLDPAIASIRKDVNEEKRNRKKANLSAFVEKNQLAHRIAPHEMDAAGGMPTLLDELMGLDDEKVVHKFSEGGKVKELTQLDVAMLRIERRPPMKFTEKIKSGTAKPGDPNDDEVVKVRQYAEDPSFAKVLAASGQTPADYVHKFSEAKKKRPSLTAAEYGVPKAD